MIHIAIPVMDFKTVKIKTMRTMIFSTVVLFATLSWTHDVCAQGTLQFNQVLLFEVQGSVAFSVPAGKVWKIESTSVPSTSGTYTMYIRNAASVNIGFLHYSSNYASQKPIWLPSGYTGFFYVGGSGITGLVSILEFNVIP